MQISSYLNSKSLNINNLPSDLEGHAELAKEAINKGKEEFFKVILESDKKKQELLGQFHTMEEQIELVLEALPNNFLENVLSGSRVIDPSCGVGNFLIKVVKDSISLLEQKGKSRTEAIEYINKNVIPNLHGIEIDPSLSLSVETLFIYEFDGKVNIPNIHLFDSLFSDLVNTNNLINAFDYVIGNPPWVDVKKLPDEVKEKIQNTFNVSNLYGAFIIDSKKFLKAEGHLSFVVPRSFTGGKYYSKLRDFLKSQVSLNKVFYFNDRNQKFHGGKVLQEIVVLSYSNESTNNKIECIPNYTFNKIEKDNSFQVSKNEIFNRHDNIMLLPESQEELNWLNNILSHKNFEDHGIRFSTGQLVTHRAKNFMKDTKTKKSHRVIYSHDIINDLKSFKFREEPNDSKQPYAVTEGIKNSDGRNKKKEESKKNSSISNWLNNFNEIIIMRRRSHKGDKRRFVGAYLKEELPETYFLDNSLNFICDENNNKMSPSLIAFYKILCSDVFERFFSAISSNTQINKNDMHLLGLPDKNKKTNKLYSQIEKTNVEDKDKLNSLIYKLYEQ